MTHHTSFICSVCGQPNRIDGASRHRELLPCAGCHSNARFRAIACHVVYAATGQVGVLADQPERRDFRGIGISDTETYARVLASKYDYTNTFLHTEPMVDIEDAASFGAFRPLNFIICSDVIEHTLRPPPKVLHNLFSALEPGGWLVLSAPTYAMADSVERYPSMAGYAVTEADGAHHAVIRTTFGTQSTDTAPVFHGGPGRVLEVRVLSHEQLLAEVRMAGFEIVPVPRDSLEAFGANWPHMVERSDVPYPMNGEVVLARRPLGQPFRS